MHDIRETRDITMTTVVVKWQYLYLSHVFLVTTSHDCNRYNMVDSILNLPHISYN